MEKFIPFLFKNMKQNIYDHKDYIGQAFNFLKVEADAEDAVQNALILFLKYKDKLKVEEKNYGRTISWLLKQECIRIYNCRRNLSQQKYSKESIVELDKFSEVQRMTIEQNYFTYNNGPTNYDMKVIKNNENYINKYFNLRPLKPLLVLQQSFKEVRGKKYIRVKVNNEFIKKHE